MQVIQSRENSKLKALRALLRSRHARADAKAYVLEGIRGLEPWMGARPPETVPIREIWVSDAIDEQDLRRLQELAVPMFQIPHRIMESVSDCRTSSGVLAVMRCQEIPLELRPEKGTYLLLDAISDPGNLGTLIRTAAAFGVDGVFLYGDAVDLYNPKSVRATKGALSFCPVWTVDKTIFIRLEEAGYELIPTVVQGGDPLPSFQFGSRTVLAIGNESRGVSEAVLRYAGRRLTIPMAGGTESLNAATAGAICLYAVSKEQGNGPGNL